MMVQTTLTFFSPNFSLELFQTLERGRQPPLLVICIDNHCSQVWLCLFSFYPRLPPPPQVQANMVVNKQAMGGYDEYCGWKWSRVLSHASSQPPTPTSFSLSFTIMHFQRAERLWRSEWTMTTGRCSPHLLLSPLRPSLPTTQPTLQLHDHTTFISDRWLLVIIFNYTFKSCSAAVLSIQN